MPLPTGSRLGPYSILDKLGEGGMGEVYRARDTTLQRDVALKILPPAFGQDADRVARFRREAQTLAALNHPNIAHIYGFDDQTLVMELVDGEDLSQRLRRGPLPLAEALPIARQIADALECAHEQGIVHRDLKPANVKVRPDGTAKVLDFGLAKAIDPSASSSDAGWSTTMASPGTAIGTVMGTAAYMSPEQAKGRSADKRTDVWAFGALVYEMVTGRRAFQGDDVTETLAAVMRDRPDWLALPADTPPRLRHLLERCLERDVRLRLRDIGEARIEIAKIEAGAPDATVTSTAPTAIAASTTASVRPQRRPGRVAALAGGAAILASLVTAGAIWALRPRAADAPPIRFTIAFPPGAHISSTQRTVLTVSPDGRRIVYSAASALYLRAIDAFDALPIRGTEAREATEPVFSPDGKWIAYWSAVDQTVQKIAPEGGTPETLCQTELPSGLSWTADGLVFAETEGVFRIPPGGGTPEQLIKATTSTTIFEPQILPGGKAVLLTEADATGGTERWDTGRIVVRTIGSDASKVLVEGGTDARYVSSGHLIFARAGVVYAAGFDVHSLALTSPAVPVVDGVLRGTGTFGSGTMDLNVSPSGVLAYVPGPLTPGISSVRIAWFDFAGVEAPLAPPPGSYQTPRLSPDDTQVAFVVDDGREANVWTYTIGTSQAPRRLTFGGSSRSPVWSADSRRVAYRSNRDGVDAIYWQTADGAGAAEPLTPGVKGSVDWPDAFSPDGRVLLFDRVTGGRAELWQLSLADRRASRVGTIASTQLTGATFSPDGKWIALATREGRQRNVVYVEPFPVTGVKYQASSTSDDAHHPLWSPSGDELFFTPGPGVRMIRVPVMRGASLAFGAPTTMPRPFANNAGSADRPYDIARDGKRFLSTLNPAAQPGQGDSIQVVVNWFTELRAKVGRSGRRRSGRRPVTVARLGPKS